MAEEPIPAELLAPWAVEPDGVDFETDDRAFAAAVVVGALGAPAERFHVTDLGEAAWAMGKLANAQSRLDAVRAQAAAWRANIDSWEEIEARGPERSVFWFTGLLVEWQRGQLLRATGQLDPHELPKGVPATSTLPHGKVSSRWVAPGMAVVDERELLAWAEENHPDLVQHVAPNVTALATVTDLRDKDGEPVAVDKATGERVPGVAGRPGRRNYTVKPS